MNNSEIIIYQTPDGNVRLDVRLEDDTVWLTQAGKISHPMTMEKFALEYERFKDQQKQLEHEQSLKELERDIMNLKTQAGDKEN